ncbi:sensor histidine kinase [Candidatus Clostridium stratigraminis]|uniref:histidine kinase n=1 Tax=Candidatus Clostridium stratigraminis TaxID=3381661 RepID=A0ABW8TAR5_9CLOT
MKRISKKISEYLKFKSIRFIITFSFACIAALAVIFIGVLLSGKFSKTAEQNVALSTTHVIEQVSLNLDNYEKSMVGITNLIERNINNVPELPNSKIEEKLDVIFDTRDDIVSIAIFTNKGELVEGTPFSKLKKNVKVTGQEWFYKGILSSNTTFLSAPHVENLYDGKYNWVLSLSKPVSFYYQGKVTQGVLLIDLNFNSIEQLCQKVNLGKRGYIYILDSKNNIIYHPQQELIYNGLKSENNEEAYRNTYGTFKQTVNNEERLLTIKNVGYTDWKVVAISYMDELTATKNSITNFSIIILFLGILFIVIIFIIISAKITNPIKQLDESMKLVEEGYLDVKVDIKGDKEVVHLSRSFNLMIANIKQLMHQIVIEQESKRKSELDALQAQINPHFLYNTLDSIVWMAENGKSQDVITMVTSLARLFRISISRGKNIITVREELEHARNYLIIQKIRYKSKFNFSIEAVDEVLQYKTLKLIIQPIIENALYHGIEYMVEEGFIKIRAKKVEEKLLFEIKDNGLGMKAEVLENILSYTANTKGGGSGVGVKNVHERIQLTFGKEYGLEIESELEEGTTVRIYLPLLKDEEYEKYI